MRERRFSAVKVVSSLFAVIRVGSGSGLPWNFDEDVARAFASLTQASYCDDDAERDGLRTWSCEECRKVGFELIPESTKFVQKPGLLQNNATFALVSRLKLSTSLKANLEVGASPQFDGCVVSIRGSDTLSDWLRDLQVWHDTVPSSWCDGCEVSSGWKAVMDILWPNMTAGLRDIGCVPRAQIQSEHESFNGFDLSSSVYVTGHSLGAAVATLAMYAFHVAGYDVRQSFLFESPRVGNSAFRSAFGAAFQRNVPVWRMTHSRDPVPHLPFSHFGYEHVNYEVFVQDDCKVTVCNETEDLNCSNQFYFTTTLMYPGDHCKNPLAAGNGSLCLCPFAPSSPRSTNLTFII